MKQNKYEIDMCNGTIMDKLISFSLPLMPVSYTHLARGPMGLLALTTTKYIIYGNGQVRP